MMPEGTQSTAARATPNPATIPSRMRGRRGSERRSWVARNATGTVSRKALTSVVVVIRSPRLSEDALWPEEEDENHHQECDPGPVRRIEERTGRLPDDAYHQGANQGAVRVADGPQDPRGEEGEEQQQATLGSQLDAEAVQGSASGGECPADDPGPHDHAFGVDAGHPGQVRIVGGGPHRLAHLRVLEEQVDEEDQEQRQAQDEELVGTHPDPREQLDGGTRPAPVEEGEVGAPAQVDEASDDQGDTDRGHREDDGGALAVSQTREHHPVDEIAHYPDDSHGAHHRYEELVAERERPYGVAHGHEADEQQAQVGAAGHEVAVREVGDAQDAEDEGQTNRPEGENAAQHHPTHGQGQQAVAGHALGVGHQYQRQDDQQQDHDPGGARPEDPLDALAWPQLSCGCGRSIAYRLVHDAALTTSPPR